MVAYTHFRKDFFHDTSARGHQKNNLKKLFLTAVQTVDRRSERAKNGFEPKPEEKGGRDTLKPRWLSHTQGIQLHHLQQNFEKILAGHVLFNKVIVAQKRQKNVFGIL